MLTGRRGTGKTTAVARPVERGALAGASSPRIPWVAPVGKGAARQLGGGRLSMREK
ncbi:hypothetical protein [uncultured Mycobacterium sp.]|uniref:hypothetical protein n=1 Tax=uncultured Mycobacterium sp. TaxID=171292 RepID=UPI0035CB625F